MAVRNNSRAWLVCFGNFVILFLETGMVKALGVLLPVLRQQFTTKTWIIGSIISLIPGIGAVTCPIGGALSKRFSARITVMTFSLLCAFGFVIGSTASSIQMLLLAFVLTGFSMGSGGVITSELARHFDKNFNVANAIARTGLSIGLIVMPLVIQYCIDKYGWRGTLLLLGGVSMHCIVAGAVLKPIPISYKAVKAKDVSTKDFGPDNKYKKMTGDGHSAAIDINIKPIPTSSKEKPISVSYKASNDSTKECGQPPDNMYNDEVTRDGNGAAIDINIIDKTTTQDHPNHNHRKQCSKKMVYYLDLELFKDFGFIRSMIYIFGCGYCNTGWLIYLVPFALTLGIPPYESAFLATVGGIGQLLGTIIFPLLTRKLKNTAILYLTSVIMSISLALNPLFSYLNSYAGLICSAVGFGLGRGSGLLANLQIAKENTKSDKMTNVFTWLNVAYAVGSISSGFLSGYIYDQTGNFTMSFFILGAVAILSVGPQLFTDTLGN